MAVWLLASSVITTACLLKGWARLAPSPFLPLACLPMRCLTFPITTCSADGEGTLPSSLKTASWQSSRCSQICMRLRRSWPSGPHRDGAYPSSAGLMSLCNFYSRFGVLHPTWAHRIFCEASPGRPFAVTSSSIMKTFAPFGDSWRQFTAICFVCLVLWGIGHSEARWAGTLNFAVTSHSVSCRFLLLLSMNLSRSTQLNLLCWYNQLCIGNGIFLWSSSSLPQAHVQQPVNGAVNGLVCFLHLSHAQSLQRLYTVSILWQCMFLLWNVLL